MKISKTVMLLSLLAIFAGSVLIVPAAQAQAAPHIYASDLESGPNVGGQNNQGVWVTIYGNGFGASQSTSQVKVGNVAAYRYALWSDSKISFQIGSGAVSGNITVTVAGAQSNGVPFTVRAGAIYFVSPNGSDTRQGTYNKPWKTLSKALSSMQPGDTVYAMNGTSAASLTMPRSGSAGAPIAIVAFPGATATVGSSTGASTGISGGTNSYWVLAGLTLRGATEAVNMAGTNWRLAGNDVSCPNGTGDTACLHATSGSQIKVIANIVHDSGAASGNVADYASVQLSASNVEVGWNTIANTRSCRALTFFTSNAYQYGLSVHDNYIHDAVCDGISFASTDPSKGAVKAYNNIIKHVGTGPAPGGVEATYTCIRTDGSGQGTVQLLNNTLYDCGARGNGDSGAIAASTPTAVSNNIVSLASGQSYITPNTSTANLSGSNDLFWGSSYIPAPFTNSLNADPLFVDPANANFSLQPTSPAIDAGMASGVTKDYFGVSRPQGNAYDMGAIEFSGTKGTTSMGQLTENPSSLDFGSVMTGTNNTQSVTVTNSGTASATISQMNVTGTGFSATGLTLPATLAPGQSATFTVTYAPQSSGNSTGSVALISNASNSTSTVQLTGSATAPAGTLSASPGSLNFGSVALGSSPTQNVTLSASTASVTISQATVTGSGYSVSGLTLPATIAAGQSLTFQVKFAPTTAGSVNGNIALASNASNTPTNISLTGTGGSTAGTLSASPTSLNFGSLTTGTSATQNVTVSATTASVTISQATVTGAGYSVSGLTLPSTIAAGQSLTFQVKFAPTAAGTANGSVALTSNASNSPTSIALSGIGTNPVGTLSASPLSLSFGSVTVGSSATQNVTVSASTASVTISQATVTGAGYSVTGLTLPTTIAAGQSLTFQVKFAPTTAGAVVGSLSFVSNASNSPNVSMSGTGAAASGTNYSIWSSTATPAVVDAGDTNAVEIGVKFTSDVAGYITGIRFYKASTNTGTHVGNLWSSTGTKLASATFTNETASGWQQVSFATPVAITAGTVYTASYYAPVSHYSDSQNYFATAGTDNPPLHAQQNGGVFAYGSSSTFPNQTWNASNYWVDVVFSTTASIPATLAATPTSLSFGNVTVGSGATQNVTVTASGSSVTVSQANVTGAGFSISGLTLPKTLAAGQSATFQVKYAPTATGSSTGTVSLISNASNSTLAIGVSGSGTTASSSHSAALNWTGSSSTGVTGYNVYRGSTSGGPYSKVNGSLVSGPSYTDSSVTAGATYYYVVTAVNSSGAESSYSSQATAVVPTP